MMYSYWQLMLSAKSQTCHSIITPDGIFTVNCVRHCKTIVVTYLHSSLTAIIREDLRRNVLIWFDDILIQAETVARLQE